MNYRKYKRKKSQFSRKAYAAGRRDEKTLQLRNTMPNVSNNSGSGPGAAVYLASCALGPVGPLLVWFGWGK